MAKQTRTEKVIEDAELAATYFRTLVANGMHSVHATQICGSYVQYRLVMEASKDKPRDPWDPPT